ncbi:MAG: AEC family transporter [Leptospiraceae bacterium]|nr:AEC family transporter [Leptospiraceae bacterium]
MAPLILIAIALIAGYLLRRAELLPDQSGKALSGYVIYVALPALVLLHVHELTFVPGLLFSALMPHAIFWIAFAFFSVAGRLLHLRPTQVIALTLLGGLGNTSFVGLPMIEAFFGPSHLSTGIVIDQAGSFLCLSTSGLLLLMTRARPTIGSEASVDWKEMGRRIVRFPPFIALAIALLLRATPYPPLALEVLERIGSTLTPVAMVAVGFQLQFQGFTGRRGLLLGLLFRLIIAPVLVGCCAFLIHSDYLLAHNPEHWILRITVFEAAMPPMITAGILCMQYDLESKLVGMMLGIGIPTSLLTLWILASFLT